MRTTRVLLVALIATFPYTSSSRARQFVSVLAHDQASQQVAPAPSEDLAIKGALCQIVYQVDRDPSPLGYRYLFYGNGFFVNEDGYVLTAAHVLSELEGGQPYLLLRTKAGPPRFVQADVVEIDHDHDVALLRATPNPFEGSYDVSFLPLATDNPVPGQTVFAAALRPTSPRNSYTAEPIIEQYSHGAVLDFEFSQLEDARAETELFVFSHSVQPGQSGAAVISPLSHAVMGLVEGQWLRGALTALAAAKHDASSNDSDSPADSESDTAAAPIPGAVIPIHYAISLLQQQGVAWHGVPEVPHSGEGAAASVIEGSTSAPMPLSLVPAPFPSQSFFGGEVLLDALVDRTGALSDVRVIQGEDPFLEKALAAVPTWMFLPARASGQPVEKRITIAFEFPQPYIPPRSASVHNYGDATSVAQDDGVSLPITTIEPQYPNTSSKPGSVILYGSVDAEGHLGSIQVVRGAEPLNSAAIGAVRDWKFTPSKATERSADSTAVIVVTFRQPLVISRKR